ncbi:MAG: TonB-dependent receptor [Phormidesmis sp. FL-bin-119]|nr:TonB-dependent receptor [Pedobacter sp.]
MKAITITIYILFSFVTVCTAQVKNDKVGIIAGQIKDSLDLTNLSEATIAVYTKAESSLLKYQLANSVGRFKISELPINAELKLVVTYVGYVPIQRFFRLSLKTSDTVFKNLNLSKSELSLDEVVIQQSPMMMRGDTLIFNVSAFASKPNAVIGDLIKNLPGIIIWGDGKITVNGKPVSRVLVGGKTFFSGDPAIAFGNIPTDAVKSVQVIPDKFDFDNSGDTTVRSSTINIELKNGNKRGVFSKIEYGQGTAQKNDGTITLASFTEKSQLSIGFNANNINKWNYDIGALLSANTFKSGGLTSEIKSSDFGRSGLHKSRFGGAKYGKDWSQRIKSESEYNMTSSEGKFVDSEQTIALLTSDVVNSNSQSGSINTNRSQNLTNKFEYRDSVFNELIIISHFNKSITERNNSNLMMVKDGLENKINESSANSNTLQNSNGNNLDLSYRHKGRSGLSKEDFIVKYLLSNETVKADRDVESTLISRLQMKEFNRSYAEASKVFKHRVEIDYQNIDRVFAFPFQMNFDMSADYRTSSSEALVSDLGSVNTYLTNENQNNLLELRPTLGFYKSFSIADFARNIKGISFNAEVETRHSSHINKSDKNFRTFGKNYSTVTPNFGIKLLRRKVNNYLHEVGLQYNTDYKLPTLEQISPLVDSSQLSQYYFGNPNIKPEYIKNYEVNYTFIRERLNGIRVGITISRKIIKNFITDSIFYDNEGVRNVFIANVNGFQQLSVSVNFSKNIKFGQRTITWKINSEIGNTNTPIYINHQPEISHTRLLKVNSNVVFRYNNDLTFRLRIWANEYKTQLAQSASFRSSDIGTQMHAIYSWKRVMFANSVDLNFNKTGDFDSNLVIWNAFISTRFSKTEQFELKLSANDILNDNANVQNFVTAGVVGVRTSNRIRQFVMISFAYYPRFFGRETSDK